MTIRRGTLFASALTVSLSLVACATPAERAGRAADALLANPGPLIESPVFARLPEDAGAEELERDRERRSEAEAARASRVEALEELQDVGPDPAARALTARLDRGSIEGRRFLVSVLQVLGKRWVRSARVPLLETFESLDPAVQVDVLGLLRRLDATDAELFKLARRALRSESEPVRSAARLALARGFPKNRERLRADLGGLVESDAVKRPVDPELQREVLLVHAIAALGGMTPDAEAHALARAALLGADKSLREPAALLLRSMPENIAERTAILAALLATGDESYARTLAGLLIGFRASEREPHLNALLRALPGDGPPARVARPTLDLLLAAGRGDRTFGPQLQAAIDDRRAALKSDKAASAALESIIARRDERLAKPLN